MDVLVNDVGIDSAHRPALDVEERTGAKIFSADVLGTLARVR